MDVLNGAMDPLGARPRFSGCANPYPNAGSVPEVTSCSVPRQGGQQSCAIAYAFQFAHYSPYQLYGFGGESASNDVGPVSYSAPLPTMRPELLPNT